MQKFLSFLLLILGTFITSSKAQQALQFIPNEGQWSEPFLYKGITSTAEVYLEHGGITYSLGANDNFIKIHDYKEGLSTTAPTLNYHAYKMKWLHANYQAQVVSSKKQNAYHNYFLGNDPNHWKSNVGIYLNVDYKELYSNIDLHIGSEKGNLKYDFIVHPNGNPSDIQLEFEGLNKVKLEQGKLVLSTSVGEIHEFEPFAFQFLNGERKEVACNYKLEGNRLSFEFPEGYDLSQVLTIDPEIIFATLTGSTSDNWGFSATYDKNGNLYAGGIVSGPGYPTTTGAYQLIFGGGTTSILNGMPCDISISKFNTTGNALIYSTYLGGADNEMPHSMVVDTQSNLVIAGKTFSTNFPVTSTAYGQTSNGQCDIFVTKLNATGSALIGSTYIGGAGNDGVNIAPDYTANQTTLRFNYGDNARSEVIVDKQNNVYVASCSQSSNFPVTSNASKSTMTDFQDGVVFKMNSNLSQLLWSTYLGGSSDDAAYVLALDTAQKFLYVGGGTQSGDFFPIAMSNALYPSYQGGLSDGFICRFRNGNNYQLLQATYMGTDAYDQVYGVQTDLENGVYAMGQTMGAFPVNPASSYQNAGSPQFLIKVDSLLSQNTYSTVWGSGPSAAPNISPVAFLVDTCQNVYISGWGGISPGTSTNGLPITPDALQSTTDGSDFYFIVFKKNLIDILYASFFGASGKPEHVDGGTSRFNPQGEVYQAICASCGGGTGFPSTPNAYSTVNGSSNCNLGAVKIAFNLGSVNAEAEATPNATGCAPLVVNFGNTSTNATSYDWFFGDGSPNSSDATPTHTYNTPGVYTVMMVAFNPNACKIRDTVYLTVTVSDAEMTSDFSITKLDSCDNFQIALTNLSTPISGGDFSNTTFTWDYGDGATFVGQNPPTHTYTAEGTYTVTLIVVNPDACNSPDTVVKTVTFDVTFVDAGFTAPNVCAGAQTNFANTSTNATTALWNFGDGNASSDISPNHVFAEGSYTVTLIAGNPTTCNLYDTFTTTITAYPSPTAQFSYIPLQPETNEPTQFINQSTGATTYLWEFGDGATTNERSPVHQYLISGAHQACLTVTNEYGCTDKRCVTIYSDIMPLADVPSAFSPNGDGVNDIVFVRGFAIKSLNFQIFNRWGEKVFESTNQEKGWDGTYNGQPQEMDAYAFVLDVVFLDNTTFVKKGNITLIR